MQRSPVFVVLLRAIGPWTHKIMSMSQWRDAVGARGFDAPETLLATGNMIVGGNGTTRDMAAAMDAVVTACGLTDANRAIVRTPQSLRTLCDADPFTEASRERPSQMGVYFFAESEPDLGWVADYQGPERLAVVEGHLIIDYGGPISKSTLTGKSIEKLSGPATARNWNTLRLLAERASGREQGSDRSS
ncbi:MAG TPA: DUF1697 domain-containing protein [Pelagibacterium sp.]|uniref:DUF1697 domain-containing protein n=1 Tax=Pelagibacterium sp. TaxID=1967288 RepID=UPI002C73EFBC|nr:DUF1697 domain-containing protein [Pelagibacterium sp.]HWJ87841.1 DUF1697 domain-containing protein [Pelagibacterium sp.]